MKQQTWRAKRNGLPPRCGAIGAAVVLAAYGWGSALWAADVTPAGDDIATGAKPVSSGWKSTYFGFKKSYTVVDGYEGDKATSGPEKGQRTVNGWKNAQLPWSYKLETRKVYTDPL